MSYDYIIVGAGPTGLTLAWYLSQQQGRVLVVDKEATIGGCHRVTRRPGGIFSEHGPRIYLNNYYSFKQLLKDMNLPSFEELFTPITPPKSMVTVIRSLSPSTLLRLGFELLFPGKVVPLKDWLGTWANDKDRHILDDACRLVDGGTLENFRLDQFLQILNQNAFFKTYQPKIPNDQGLLLLWERALRDTGRVDFLLETEVLALDKNTIVCQGQPPLTANKECLLAIPPRPLIKLLKRPDLTHWERKCRYHVYIPVQFQWAESAPQIPYHDTDWGIVWINIPNTNTISTAVKFTETKSTVLKKTANECIDDKELVQEVWRQLAGAKSPFPPPTFLTLSPEMYYNYYEKRWDSTTTAYFHAVGVEGKPSLGIGTHNGHSTYNFTSLESAVQNARAYLGLPPISIPFWKTVRGLSAVMVVIIIVVVAWLLVKKNN